MSKQKILIPLDGSTCSRQILPEIVRYFNPADNDLILLHVARQPHGVLAAPAQPTAAEWPVPMYRSDQDVERVKHPIYASQVQDNLIAELEHEFSADQKNLKAAGFNVSVLIGFGDPARKILNVIKDEQVNLVAMTTHGHSGLHRLIFGSVAERVLRGSSVPVLFVQNY